MDQQKLKKVKYERKNVSTQSSSSHTGNSVANIASGSRQNKAIKAVNTSSHAFSHFVSLPLAVYPELVNKLIKLQNSILESSDASSNMDIDSSLFIKPKTFHLTVIMLKLWNNESLEAAMKVLQSVSTKVVDALDNRHVSIRLKGLECFSDSLAKARVLYVPVEEVDGKGRLLRACQVIIDAFVEAGLVHKNYAQRKLKLHATVMNVQHRERQRNKINDFFDARKIVEKYGTMEWGEFVISKAHLSNKSKFEGNGYYHCCASIPFPVMQQSRLIYSLKRFCCLPF